MTLAQMEAMNLADTALELNPDNEGAAHLKIIASAILHAHRSRMLNTRGVP